MFLDTRFSGHDELFSCMGLFGKQLEMCPDGS
jgi:hypothetical protein